MRLRIYTIFIVLGFFVTHCGEQQTGDAKGPSLVSDNTIPEIREKVSTKPVASYLISIDNPALEYKFGVSVFETPHTFKFLLRMQYEGMIELDTLNVPNFGIPPVVEVKPGPEKLSCIIGFLDKDKKFKEYKMLSIKDGELALSVLKRYGVGVYRKQVK